MSVRLKLMDYINHRLFTATLTTNKLCLSKPWAEWLGLDIGTQCYPATPSTYTEILKLAVVLDSNYYVEGYVLPDTIRFKASTLVLITLTDTAVYEVLYDLRTGEYGVQFNNAFRPLKGVDVKPRDVYVMVGTLVEMNGFVKAVGITPKEVYAQFASAVATKRPEAAIESLANIRAMVESYEKAINELRMKLITAFADQAAVVNEIFSQYVKPAKVVEQFKRAMSAGGGEQGGEQGPPRRGMPPA